MTVFLQYAQIPITSVEYGMTFAGSYSVIVVTSDDSISTIRSDSHHQSGVLHDIRGFLQCYCCHFRWQYFYNTLRFPSPAWNTAWHSRVLIVLLLSLQMAVCLQYAQIPITKVEYGTTFPGSYSVIVVTSDDSLSTIRSDSHHQNTAWHTGVLIVLLLSLQMTVYRQYDQIPITRVEYGTTYVGSYTALQTRGNLQSHQESKPKLYIPIKYSSTCIFVLKRLFW